MDKFVDTCRNNSKFKKNYLLRLFIIRYNNCYIFITTSVNMYYNLYYIFNLQNKHSLTSFIFIFHLYIQILKMLIFRKCDEKNFKFNLILHLP